MHSTQTYVCLSSLIFGNFFAEILTQKNVLLGIALLSILAFVILFVVTEAFCHQRMAGLGEYLLLIIATVSESEKP